MSPIAFVTMSNIVYFVMQFTEGYCHVKYEERDDWKGKLFKQLKNSGD